MNGLGPMLQAPGRERPDLTVFSFPAATLTDGSAEEIEIDQALSLVGRRGRDFLGVAVIEAILTAMFQEHLTIGDADHAQSASFRLATRTGAFNPDDPELLWYYFIGDTHNNVSVGTDAGPIVTQLQPIDEGGNGMLGEPFLYVSPRLFWRVQNDFDQSLAVDELSVRWGSIPVRLTFFTFIELLERFANVQLL